MIVTAPATMVPEIVSTALCIAAELCEDSSPALSLAMRVLKDLSRAGDGEKPVEPSDIFVWATELRFALRTVDDHVDSLITALRDAGIETQ